MAAEMGLDGVVLSNQSVASLDDAGWGSDSSMMFSAVDANLTSLGQVSKCWWKLSMP